MGLDQGTAGSWRRRALVAVSSPKARGTYHRTGPGNPLRPRGARRGGAKRRATVASGGATTPSNTLVALGRRERSGAGGELWSEPSPTGHSYPPRSLFEQVGNMMILTGKTIAATVRPPYPYGGEFVGQFLFALQLCWFPMLISHGRLRLRRAGASGGQLPLPVRRARPPRRLLHPRLGARVRAVRDRGRRRRRRRHRDHRRPRGAQDPRGARRAAGAGRRPDQEPRRAALPRADADHRAARHLRAAVRDRRRDLRRDRLRPAAGRLLRHPLQQRLGHRPLGLDPQVHDVRGDHRRSSAPTRG